MAACLPGARERRGRAGRARRETPLERDTRRESEERLAGMGIESIVVTDGDSDGGGGYAIGGNSPKTP